MNFVWCLYGEEHAEYARKSAETVLKQMPRATCIFYVDQLYDGLGKVGIQMPYPEAFRQPFMVGNILCQVDWLMNTPADNNEYTIFLDTDTVHSKPVGMQFLDDENADIYATYRRNLGKLSDQMPYNYGVLIVRHSVAAKHAMHWLLQRVLKLHPARQKWYGNQIALRELVGPVNPGKPCVREMGYFSFVASQLSCDEWNWSPNPKHCNLTPGTTKHFIHLKGKLKKEWFERYYNRVMGIDDGTDWEKWKRENGNG